jgi:hypothetical protein
MSSKMNTSQVKIWTEYKKMEREGIEMILFISFLKKIYQTNQKPVTDVRCWKEN